jgi:hypothetical protein
MIGFKVHLLHSSIKLLANYLDTKINTIMHSQECLSFCFDGHMFCIDNSMLCSVSLTISEH